MSVFIDRKYLGQISSRLDLFKQKKTDLFNFRCPYCGDSQKNRTKTRGYIYRKENNYFFRCHNCSVGTTFSNFLKTVDPQSHKEYVLECYTEGLNKHTPVEKPDFSALKGNAAAKLKTKRTLAAQPISELADDHYAKQYVVSRKIPPKHFGILYYTPNFAQLVKDEFHDIDSSKIPDDDRIVLLYKNSDGQITNIAGRALSNTKIRYVTVKVSDEPKVFGLERLNVNDQVYITEGQFDSLFLDNAVAAGDSNLVGLGGDLCSVLAISDPVLVFDNEPRNKDIVKLIDRAISQNYKVVIYPDTIEAKDLNDMVLTGIDVKTVVKENTYSGLEARLKFMSWKKC